MKYRECNIPKDIEGLLYGDLSQENVRRDGNYVKFIGEGYEKFLNKLLNGIKAKDNRLDKADRDELKKEVTQSEKKNEQLISSSTQVRHKIVKYRDVAAIDYYRNLIIARSKALPLEQLQPVVLPAYYKLVFKDLKTGNIIRFQKLNGNVIEGHFAAYRRDTSGIAIPPAIRRFLDVHPRQDVAFTVNAVQRTFTVSWN